MNLTQDVVSLLSIVVNVLLTIFFFGAIPFCMNVIRKLSAIEVTLKNNEWQGTEITHLKDKIHELELARAKCLMCSKANAIGEHN